MELTWRQKAFANRYIANGLRYPVEAARYAGYSEHSIREIASENLRKPQIKQYIERNMKEAAEKLGITPEYLLNKLKTGVEMSIPDIKDDEFYAEKALKLKTADVRAGVTCINEINKMIGNHDPEKKTHDFPQLQDLIDEYNKDH